MGGWRQAAREFLYGMFIHEHVQEVREMHASLESLFLLVTFGDMVGLPILPPYYGLRLLPHALRGIPAWRRRVLREREIGDSHDHHLHGV